MRGVLPRRGGVRGRGEGLKDELRVDRFRLRRRHARRRELPPLAAENPSRRVRLLPRCRPPPLLLLLGCSARGSQRSWWMQQLMRNTCWWRSSPPLRVSSLSFLQAGLQIGKPLETV
jgi:hypothetical protein